MRIATILLISITFSTLSFAQGARTKKADQLFQDMSYALAAEKYEKLIGTKSESNEVKRNLAYSYLKINQYQQAIKYYSQMIETDVATNEDYYNFAFALKVMGDYEESDKWMKRFADNAPTDLRGKLFNENPNYLMEIKDIRPFFDMTNTKINTSGSEFGGYLTPDEKTVYFLSERRDARFVKHRSGWSKRPFLDIYKATLYEGNYIGKPVRLSSANSTLHEGPLAFSPDGRTVYFSRNNDAKGEEGKDADNRQRIHLFVANIDDKGDFVNVRPFPYNSKDYSIGHPAISTDGKTLYLASDKPGGFGGMDLYKVEIDEDGGFGPMQNLGDEVNTEGNEAFPFVNEQGDVFFSSDGRPGLGGLDVYVVKYRGTRVTAVENLGEPVNSQFDDFAFTLSNDGFRGFVSSNREGGVGADDIYSISSIRPLVFGVIFTGVVVDADENPITHAIVEVRDEKTGELLYSTFTVEDGTYHVVVDFDKEYMIRVTKQDFQDGRDKATSFTRKSAVKTDFVLEKK